ncbi:MAG: ATP-binding cassette domain-containing protein [Bacillota bacterium]
MISLLGSKRRNWFVVALVGVLGVLPLVHTNPYHVSLVTRACLYVVLASGLNLLVGLAGLLDMGYVGFYALGAYCYALLASPQLGLHVPFAGVLLAALALVGLVSALIGLSTLRLRGDYLAVVTLSFGEVLRTLLLNLDRPVNVTNGPNGIVQIDPPRIGSLVIDTSLGTYYLMLGAAIVAYWLYGRAVRSELGLKWRALKDDQIAAQSLGVNMLGCQMVAYMAGAAFAAVAGVLFAGWQLAVFPQNFGLGELITLYCMVILGGAGNNDGTLIGVVALVLIPELLRVYSVYRMALYGAVLVALMVYRPQGMLPLGHGLYRPKHKVSSCQESIQEGPGPVLVVRNLTKRFGGLMALDGVDFELRKGEILGIIGPNGAGKTTLVNVLTGVTAPTEGELYLYGRRIKGLRPDSVYRLGIGRTFQNPRLFKSMSVMENLCVGLKPGAWASPEKLMDLLDGQLAGVQDQAAEALSYAHRKLLELARAVAGKPKVLLLDEPAAGMGGKDLEGVKQAILELKRKGHSVVLVEHQIPLVASVCDRVIVLDQGRKIVEGSPGEVMSDPQVIRVYLGERTAGTSKKRTPVAVGEPLLKLEQLEASYGHLKALRGVDIEVCRGEVVCLLGANGAGKTTTIRAILGAVRVDCGRVMFNGVDITGLSPAQTVRRGIGVVPEGRRVFTRLTVEENLRIAGGDQEVLSWVYQLFPRLRERRSQLAGTLSGGEQQMLAIGRALMGKPSLLLMDEPCMGLAPVMADRIMEAILHLNASGTTVLMVEQNAVRALSVAQRGYVLRGGSVVASGTAEELLEGALLQEGYFGVSPS